jgi:hypothetical protein
MGGSPHLQESGFFERVDQIIGRECDDLIKYGQQPHDDEVKGRLRPDNGSLRHGSPPDP